MLLNVLILSPERIFHLSCPYIEACPKGCLMSNMSKVKNKIMQWCVSPSDVVTEVRRTKGRPRGEQTWMVSIKEEGELLWASFDSPEEVR